MSVNACLTWFQSRDSISYNPKHLLMWLKCGLTSPDLLPPFPHWAQLVCVLGRCPEVALPSRHWRVAASSQSFAEQRYFRQTSGCRPLPSSGLAECLLLNTHFHWLLFICTHQVGYIDKNRFKICLILEEEPLHFLISKCPNSFLSVFLNRFTNLSWHPHFSVDTVLPVSHSFPCSTLI